MITLCCLVVRDGRVFSVKIEESELVGELKKVIKTENQYSFPAMDLTLYLAKKDGGAWLSTTNLKKDLSVDTFMKMDETYRLRNKVFGFPSEDIREDGDIHVLVVVPADQSRAPADAPIAPIGPEVVLSCDGLSAFLKGEMINQDTIISSPHILEAHSLQFELVGREEAIATAVTCYQNIIDVAGTTASDRTKQAMPVCSGISGLGKTRMLEEGNRIMHKEMNLNPTPKRLVLVKKIPVHHSCVSLRKQLQLSCVRSP